jgi:Sigma 54 modulation protein / S30EA ribosomal protein
MMIRTTTTSIAVLLLCFTASYIDAFTTLTNHVQRSLVSSKNDIVQPTTLTTTKSDKSNTILYSTAAEDQSVTKTIPIILNGQNIELTPALEEYVNKRIGGILKKLSSSNSVRECDVVLSVNKNPKVCMCFCTMFFSLLSTKRDNNKSTS